MRLPNSAHESQSWVISTVAHDFELLDVWALPVEGTHRDFDLFLECMSTFDPLTQGSMITRLLFWLRLRLGALLGWDDPSQELAIPGSTEFSLAERVPAQLRDSAERSMVLTAVQRAAGGFTPLYRSEREWAAEVSNATVHAAVHLGWVEQADGRYRAQLAIYVKPRGALGRAYLALIKPFRHLIVYPELMRQIERAWGTTLNERASRRQPVT